MGGEGEKDGGLEDARRYLRRSAGDWQWLGSRQSGEKEGLEMKCRWTGWRAGSPEEEIICTRNWGPGPRLRGSQGTSEAVG
ncbi:hypothetical protein L1887_58836 [Cichorium endivia]|nr:hypothetical protein L1887_58836 [Cichorium endivia]